MLDRLDVVAEFAQLLGLKVDGAGFELAWPSFKNAMHMADYDCYKAIHNSLLVLCMPEGLDAAEANERMPSPVALAKMERSSWQLRVMGGSGLLHVAARAFIKLGRDHEAIETASLAVSCKGLVGTQARTCVYTPTTPACLLSH